MSPALRGEDIPRATGLHHKPLGDPGPGEIRLWCDRCDWTTIRPDQYAASAREAHRIAHDKGWIP